MRSMRAFAWFPVLACAVLVAMPALAQIPNGKLTGRVTSEGSELPDVVITVTSPALQGERTTTTSATGDYLFPSLPPGNYKVTLTMQGMQPLDKELTISAAQTTRLDAEMTGAFEEAISVTGTASQMESISDTPQAATTFNKQLVDILPAGRTINQIVAMSPAVLPNGPSKSSDTGLSNITVSGAPTYENLFMINGVVLNENIRGQAFDLFIEDAIQETTTISSGVSSEYGRFSGGVINVITKSGGNDFAGSFRIGYRNQKWEEKTKLTTTQVDKTVPTYELTLGGPILHDRLWFFVAGRDRKQEQALNTFAATNIAYTNIRDQQRYEGKLTATLTPRHTLVGTYAKIDDAENGNSFGTILDRASLVNRETPQELWALNYTGAFRDNFLLTGQYSERQFTFVGSGAQSTDLIAGTLLIDNTRNGARYHSPTFCGVCTDEERDNTNALVKGSYFLSTDSLGSHELVGGYDTFEDIRVANNHQSGSDYRIVSASAAAISGTDIRPVWLPGTSTFIQYNPILQSSKGTSFVTNSLFLNDAWRFNERLSFNVGLRYDANDGEDASHQKVADDSKISPRLGMSYDTRGNGALVVNASYGTYVAALANGIADASAAGGQPSTFTWFYNGPAINGNLTQDEALRVLFDWFTAANGGLATDANPLGGGLLARRSAGLSGVSTKIRGSLSSPSVTEYSVGVSAGLGSKALVRADLVHRDWEDFYSVRTDLSTGRVSAQVGTFTQNFDLSLVENNDSLYERTYDGLHLQFRYKPFAKLDLGGNWTLSKTEGNFNGENQGSGPVLGGLQNYPEYIQVRWNAPSGPLAIDQRHRINLYGVYRVLNSERHGLNIGVVQSFFSGHPYEAAGTIAVAPYVTNPGYLTPPTTATYFFSKRGAFRTADVTRTNLAVDYELRFGSMELFFHPEVINVFDEEEIDTNDPRYLGQSVVTANGNGACSASPTGRCLAFNPFTETPVENVHWARTSTFGKATNPLAFQQPRTYLFSVGLRF